jgi:hypothetical protein
MEVYIHKKRVLWWATKDELDLRGFTGETDTLVMSWFYTTTKDDDVLEAVRWR